MNNQSALTRSYPKLFISDINKIVKKSKNENEWKLYSHPFETANIMGWVVSVNHRPEGIHTILDDGTGLLKCIFWFTSTNENSLCGIELGAIVSVWGKVGKMWDDVELHGKYFKIRNIQDEYVWWMEVIQMHDYIKTNYLSPSLSNTNQNQCIYNPNNQRK
eukprot:c10493_g1_i1.p1 GENE.c10493_g1_i1~~c10493_g1_i1.p1  ORF type:complete len:161 (+),score=44.45 c10493_g1_i1:73-555(+)